MKLYELYLIEFFSTYPETYYGYWLTDNGKFISIPKNKHAEVARNKFQELGNVHMTGEEAIDEAENAGWMRIIFNPSSGRELTALPTSKSTPQSYKALSTLIKDFGRYMKDINLRLKDTNEYYQGNNVDEALAWIDKVS